jgi:hypothetical protein
MATTPDKVKLWVTDITPRVLVSGFVISAATVDRTAGQVIALSGGKLPQVTAADRFSLFRGLMPKQTAIKTLQMGCLREIKLWFDRLSPSTAGVNSMLAYAITGVPAQSILYNLIIAGTYHHFGASKPCTETGIVHFYKRNIAPGIVWTFLREGMATGGGLWLGPMLRARLIGNDPDHSNAFTKLPLPLQRFCTGFAAGAFCAFGTQWMHNCALTAGSMAECKENPSTVSSFLRTYRNLGPAMIYVNYGRRVMIIAVASAVLNLMDIFHNPYIFVPKVD